MESESQLVVRILAVGEDRDRISIGGEEVELESVKLSDITGSLSEYAREGLREPIVVTRKGKPLVAVMPLTNNDDWESVSLATNPKFMEIIARSRASAHEEGTIPLAEIRREYGLKGRTSGRRRSR